MTLPLFPQLCACGRPVEECRFLPWHYGEGFCG